MWFSDDFVGVINSGELADAHKHCASLLLYMGNVRTTVLARDTVLEVEREYIGFCVHGLGMHISRPVCRGGSRGFTRTPHCQKTQAHNPINPVSPNCPLKIHDHRALKVCLFVSIRTGSHCGRTSLF